MQDWGQICNNNFDEVTLINVEKNKVDHWGNSKIKDRPGLLRPHVGQGQPAKTQLFFQVPVWMVMGQQENTNE